MTEDLNAMLKDICRDPDAWKTRHPADMADARAAYYTPGSNPAWGFGVDAVLESRKSPYEDQTTLRGVGVSIFLCSATTVLLDFSARQ